MKKIITILFITYCFNTFSQENFNGMWYSKTSSYFTFLLSNNTKVLEVINVSLNEHNTIKEEIIKQSKDTLTTKLYNKNSKYLVYIKYYLKTKDTLISDYSGDLNKKIKLIKII